MRTKKNPEIPMVPKAHLKNVEHQRDQYKAERDTLIDDLKVLREKNEKLEEKNKDLKDKEFNLITENNDLITISSAIEQTDDYIRGENKKLRKLKDIKEKALKGANYIIENQKSTIKRLEQENAQLKEKNERLQKAHSDGWKEKDKVIKKLHYLYTTLTDHIRLKASANPGVDRYITLVNFIDRLEKGEK